jgi:hypothetical protein
MLGHERGEYGNIGDKVLSYNNTSYCSIQINCLRRGLKSIRIPFFSYINSYIQV